MCARAPTRVLQTDLYVLVCHQHLPRLCFNHWGCREFSQTAATAGTQSLSGGWLTLRSQGFRLRGSTVSFSNTRESSGVLLPCPKQARSQDLPRDIPASLPPGARPERREHILRECAIRIITRDWTSGYLSVPSLGSHRSLPQALAVELPAALALAPPACAPSPKTFQGPFTNTTAGPHFAFTRFLC